MHFNYSPHIHLLIDERERRVKNLLLLHTQPSRTEVQSPGLVVPDATENAHVNQATQGPRT